MALKTMKIKYYISKLIRKTETFLLRLRIEDILVGAQGGLSWATPGIGHHIPAVLPPPLLPSLQAVDKSAVRTRWCSTRALLLVKADSIE